MSSWENSPEHSSHFALLVGINGYPEPHKPLKGCVRDIYEIGSFLASKLGDFPIKMLTETEPNNPIPSNIGEDAESRPTYNNVTSAFSWILSHANAGSFVYIHFSGHGVQKTEVPDNTQLANTKPLALALLSGEQHPKPPVRYLWGKELAYTLKCMVEKKLIVTLVLDCCFSGGMMRHSQPIRYLAYDPTIDACFPPDPNRCLLWADNIYSSTSRKASMLPNWLANPIGYSALAACGPTQIARELFDSQGLRHGALSYYMLRALLKLDGLGCPLGILFQHLQAMFRDKEPRQTPCLLGNMDLGFFGKQVNQQYLETHVASVKGSDRIIRLPIGEAQRVCIGDLFELSPLIPEQGDGRCHAVVACVTRLSPLGCTLKRYEPGTPFPVGSGWLAKPLTRIALQSYPIQINLNTPHRGEIQMALGAEGLAVVADPEETKGASFYVIQHSNSRYEILDNANTKLPHLPDLPVVDTTARDICGVLGHLLRYQVAKDIARATPGDDVTLPCQVQLEVNGTIFDADTPIEVTHGDVIRLNTKNQGDKDLYLFVYNIGPLWEVEELLKSSHAIVTPGRQKTHKIKMIISDELIAAGYTISNDIIKVFVTTQWTSFDLLMLPELGEARNTQISTKGDKRGQNDVPLESWVSFNFLIQITL